MTEEEAIEMIIHSISGGYQGLFPPKVSRSYNNSEKAPQNSLKTRVDTMQQAMGMTQFDDNGNIIES